MNESKMELLLDVGCERATRLWERNKSKVDPMRTALLERHREEKEHTPDCFVHQEATSN